jgi:hypothetical protein
VRDCGSDKVHGDVLRPNEPSHSFEGVPRHRKFFCGPSGPQRLVLPLELEKAYTCVLLSWSRSVQRDSGPTVCSTGTDSWRPCWRAWGGVPVPVSKDTVPHSGRAGAEITMQCMEIKVLIAKDVTTSKICRNLCESITFLLVLVSCTLNYFSCREQGAQPAVISRFGKVSTQYRHRC